MRFILFSDLHVHNWTDCARVNGPTTDRLLDTLSVLDSIRVYALEQRIKDVVFGGDLTHTPGLLKTAVFQLVVEAFKRFKKDGITVYGAVGNHDCQDKKGVYNSIQTLALADLIVAASFVKIRKDFTVGFVNYSDDDTTVYQESVLLAKRNVDMLVYHHGFAGAIVGNAYKVKYAVRASDLPKVWAYSGHYHQRQKLPGVTYIGSPMQQQRGEPLEPKGFLVVDTDTRKEKLIPLSLPCFVDATYNTNTDLFAGNFVDLIATEAQERELTDALSTARYVNVFRPENTRRRQITKRTYADQQTVETTLATYLREEGYPKSYNKIGLRLLNKVKCDGQD